MNYSRKFFQAIADMVAIIYSMWLFVILVFVFVFVIYLFTDYILNPWLPIGLFFLYALFKDSTKFQGLGCLIAILFTIVMLSAGRIIPQEEKEANEAAQQRQAKRDKIIYDSRLFSFRDSEGNEIPRIKDSESKSDSLFEVVDGEKVFFTFLINKKDNEDKFPHLTDKNFNAFLAKSDNPYIGFSFFKTLSYDEDTGLLEGESKFSILSDYYSDEGEFSISLTSNKEDMNSFNSYSVFYHAFHDTTEEVIDSSTNKNLSTTDKTVEPPSKEIIVDEPITESNVDDWDHILEDWELEEAEWEDEYYE